MQIVRQAGAVPSEEQWLQRGEAVARQGIAGDGSYVLSTVTCKLMGRSWSSVMSRGVFAFLFILLPSIYASVGE